VPPGQIIAKARNAASHPKSHKQHGDTRLATAPDRPTYRVSQSPEAVFLRLSPRGTIRRVAKRPEWLKQHLPTFLRDYGRTSRRRGYDPNDRQYDRKLEEEVKRMDPRELDALLHGDDE
jgi:hypothetical protein